MAAAVRSLVSRTLLDRRRRGRSGAVAGCFSVYVGAGRERFVMPVERANHPLFRRLLDDAEREYGRAAQGPLALPGCDVGAFLDVLWLMEERHDEDEEDGEGTIANNTAVLSSSPMCGLIRRSCGANGGRVVAGYRTLCPTSRSRSSLRWWI
ncbi:uncharacterized protein LOC101759037 [Setaria italica]|uniref:uncharacterized protein LOC101759037 n=1 Tax=Setaria italica TaxID=4555 RepID=UPI000351295F|nr:uncharacterized protein LOC101759037 [Setaria italica]